MTDEQVLVKLEELHGSLSQGKTPEEKRLESLISVTSDEGLKNTLEDRLEEIKAASGADPEEVIAELDDLGYPLSAVVRHGITKIRQQLKWRIKNAKDSPIDM